MSVLFGAPDQGFALTDLIARAGTGSGVSQRILARLVTAELVTSTYFGRRRIYRANRASPVFPELHSLFVKTVGIVGPIREALHPHADRIVLALIFGSIAKGAAHATSDVDLLVVTDELRLDEIYAALEPAEATIGRKISPTVYNTTEYADRIRKQNPFLTNVLANEYIELIGEVRGTRTAR